MRKLLKKGVMRILCATFLLTFFLSDAFAQQIELSFKNVPLSQVVKEIEKKTEYSFVYSDALQIEKIFISVDIRTDNIRLALDKIFEGKDVVYLIKGKQVTLTPKKLVPLKKVFVRGRVNDKNGEPLIGVSVFTDNLKYGSNTNEKGEFTIEVDKDVKNVNFKYIGYNDLKLILSAKSFYDVEMSEDLRLLEEVVVTGYQTISKERATGAFGQVKSEQIEKPASSLAERIIGTTAGLQGRVDASGNTIFEIRGQTSLNTNARPLIVVDGFAVQGEFSAINPNDVESVTILKDAAAASIWGARSANGVIVVSTKKGKASPKGGARVEISSFMKVSPKIDYNYYRSVASSEDVIDYEKRGFSTEYFGGPWAWADNIYSKAQGSMSKAIMAMNEHRLGYISQEDMEQTLVNLSKLDNTQQVEDHLLQVPFTQQYNINISGATDRMNNMLSILAEGQNKYLAGSRDQRYMVNFRTNVSLYKWLSLSFSGMFQYKKEKSRQSSLASLSPYEMLFNDDGSKAQINYGFNLPILYRTVPYGSFPYSDWTYNPISEMEGSSMNVKKIDTRIQTGLTFKIIDGLSFDSRIQYEMYNKTNDNIYDEGTFMVRNGVNTTSSWDRTTGVVNPNLPKGGFRDMSRVEEVSYNYRNQLSFDRFFGKHQISLVAGSEISSSVYQTFSQPRTYGYNDEKLTVGIFPNGPTKTKNWMGWNQNFAYTNSYSYSTDRYFSLYGNTAYTFDNKYTVSGSIRTDASNLITEDPKYRYSPFWSVGASWQMKREGFMKDIMWLNRLNVRLTYGYNGNVDKSTSFRPLISLSSSQSSYTHDYTASISSYGNPYLRWEKTGTWDFGIDFSMFNNKLWGKIDIYEKNGKDLITQVAIPSVHGTTTQKLNTARMVNRGLELEVGGESDITSDGRIKWRGTLNFSYNHNRITDLFKVTYSAYDLYGGGTRSYVQGYDANSLWVFKYAGVKNMGTEANPNWQPMVAGKGDDTYGFTSWTPGDGRDYMLNKGSLVAPFTLGITTEFKVYDFDISMIITGKFGHVFKRESFNYPSMSGGSALPNEKYREVLNSNPMEVVPIPFGKSEPRYYFWDRFYPYLDYLVESASHVRLQELNITYSMPKRVLDFIGFSSMKVFAQGNNLFTWYANKYREDPEYPRGSLKPRATYTFGVKFDF